MSEIQPIFITGKCRWACITKPNTTYEPHAWSVQLQITDDNRDIVENLIDEETGSSVSLPINNKDDDFGDYVTFKRKVLRTDGTTNYPPVIKDSQNNNWSGKLIGNESVVTIKGRPYTWTWNKKDGVSADLMGLQVVDLVEFEPSGELEGFDIVPGGYVDSGAEEIPFAS
jgi:hypothetical protein